MRLVAFQEREGHCQVPQAHKEDGHNLGRWVRTQRQMDKNDMLLEDRRERQEALGMVWDVSYPKRGGWLHEVGGISGKGGTLPSAARTHGGWSY